MVKIWFGGFYHPRSFEAHWNKYLKHDPHAADHEGNHLSSSTPTGYKNWSNRPHLSIVSKLGSSGSRASPLWVSKVWYLTKSSNSTDPPWNLRHQTQLSSVFNLHDNHKLSSSLIPSNHPKARSKSKITNLGRSLSSGWWSWQKWICPYLKLTIWDPNGFQFGYMPAKNAVKYYRFWIVTLKCTIDFVNRLIDALKSLWLLTWHLNVLIYLASMVNLRGLELRDVMSAIHWTKIFPYPFQPYIIVPHLEVNNDRQLYWILAVSPFEKGICDTF